MAYHFTAAQGLKKEAEKEQHQPAVVSNPLCDSDFPALGSDVNLTKEQKSKARVVTLRETNAPVFREAYHAQLREVHGANMRAVEAMEEDEDELMGRKRNRAVNQDTINSLMEDVIREIAAEGELVTKEKVKINRTQFESLKEQSKYFSRYSAFSPLQCVWEMKQKTISIKCRGRGEFTPAVIKILR